MMKLWWNDICELVAAFAAIVAISAIVDVTKTHRTGHLGHLAMNTARNLSWYPSTGLLICMPISDNDSKHNPRHFNIRSAHIPSPIFGWIPSWFRKKKFFICETNMNQNWECRDVCRSVSTSTIPSQSHQSHPPNNGKLRVTPSHDHLTVFCPSCWHLIVDHDDHWWS